MDQHEPPPTKSNAWLQQQWQRVRGLWARDIVIGQVGEGATNVVIGKNNVQINVGGRNLSLPIYAIAGALLVILGLLLYPLVEPIWWPTQMTGTYRIAIANFGEIETSGSVRTTARGQAVSKWFFDNLFAEYNTATNLPNLDVARTIEIWHDLRSDIDKNVTFGVIKGRTDAEREAAAAHLAARIGAHMVIYGNLVNDATGLPQLDLAFYLAPNVNDETNALVGPHRLSKPLGLPATFDSDNPDANTTVASLLKTRTDAFFWLTVGLALDIQGRSQEALAVFRQAEANLKAWDEHDGKEILYFFIGREELFLGNTGEAEAQFRHALTLNPTYARAQVGLGSALLQQARAVAPTARLQPPNLLLQALDAYLHGLELAAQSDDPLLVDLANLALAKGYRLLGETYYHLDNLAEARRFFDLTRQKATQIIPSLTAAGQYRLVAQAHETVGAAYLQEGELLAGQQEVVTAKSLLTAAQTAYADCTAQGRQIFDQVLRDQVIERCERFTTVISDLLKTLEGK